MLDRGLDGAALSRELFIGWHEARAGHMNMSARNFCQVVRSLCAQGCGWLRQQTAFRDTLPEEFRTGD